MHQQTIKQESSRCSRLLKMSVRKRKKNKWSSLVVTLLQTTLPLKQTRVKKVRSDSAQPTDLLSRS